jgi:hypothetical protein
VYLGDFSGQISEPETAKQMFDISICTDLNKIKFTAK